jgi:hypothetical protein
VLRLFLVNSETGADLFPLDDGATLNLADLPTRALNVRAVVTGTKVEAVDFGYDSYTRFRSETSAPFSLAGDDDGKFKRWTPKLGRHTLTVSARGKRRLIPKKGKQGRGFTFEDGPRSPPLVVRFTVVDTPPPPTTTEPPKTVSVPPPQTQGPSRAAQSPPTPLPTPTRGPSLLPTYHIQCGGSGFVGKDGTVWQSDVSLTRASSYGSWTADDSAAEPLYLSGRNSSGGPIEFRIPVPPGEYILTLHFMERYLATPGKSVFDISAENKPLVTGLDIVAQVGINKPYSLTRTINVDDGELTLRLTAQRGLAIISGIELQPAKPPPLVR